VYTAKNVVRIDLDPRHLVPAQWAANWGWQTIDHDTQPECGSKEPHGLRIPCDRRAGRVYRGAGKQQRSHLNSAFANCTVTDLERLLLSNAVTTGPMVERASQFRWMRQLPPAAFSVRHIPAAFSIDAKVLTIAR
jgi:hypothetical protein